MQISPMYAHLLAIHHGKRECADAECMRNNFIKKCRRLRDVTNQEILMITIQQRQSIAGAEKLARNHRSLLSSRAKRLSW